MNHFGHAVRMLGIALLSFPSACGSESSTRGQMIEQRIASARCDVLCGQASGDGWDEPERCAAVGADQNRARARAVDEGRALVDDAALEECLSQTAQCLAPAVGAPATSPRDPAAVCRSAFSGHAGPGAACEVDEECAGELFCDRGSGCGRCTTAATTGSACTRDNQCLGVGPAVLCVQGICRQTSLMADLPEGSRCGLLDVATGSASYGECAPNLRCVGAPLRCASARSREQACDPTMDFCETGLTCSDGRCQATEVAGEGEACLTSSDFLLPRCDTAAGLVCLDGTCRPYPTAGQPCAFLCESPYVCVDSICRARAPAGASCADASTCDSGACAGGICVDLCE